MKLHMRLVVSFVVLAASATTVEARIFGNAFGGAMRGAILGSLVDGREGARTGAAIGAGVGLIRGVAEESQRKAAAEAARRRYEESQRLMQQRQQAEIERLKLRQAAPATTPAADAKLVTEIQKSLVRLGIDPGDIDGTLSPATVNAIKVYQGRMKLLEDGVPSQVLLKHMLVNGG